MCGVYPSTLLQDILRKQMIKVWEFSQTSSNWESGVLVTHHGNFTNHCCILPKARKFATLWSTVLNWANELILIDMEYSLEWLENGLVRTYRSLRSDGWLSHRRLCIHLQSEFHSPLSSETLKSQKGWIEITFSPETEALDREDKHISGEEERALGIHSVC